MRRSYLRNPMVRIPAEVERRRWSKTKSLGEDSSVAEFPRAMAGAACASSVIAEPEAGSQSGCEVRRRNPAVADRGFVDVRNRSADDRCPELPRDRCRAPRSAMAAGWSRSQQQTQEAVAVPKSGVPIRTNPEVRLSRRLGNPVANADRRGWREPRRQCRNQEAGVAVRSRSAPVDRNREAGVARMPRRRPNPGGGGGGAATSTPEAGSCE